MAKDENKINTELLEVSREIFSTLAEQRPEVSFSFSLTPKGVDALADVGKIIEWGIGGNKSKLKETALEIYAVLGASHAGAPINVNFTEYDLKSIGEVVLAIEKARESHDDGILK